jgi:uncharacterized protein (DUF58 family)
MALFDSEFLQKLEYLSLVSKRVFRGQLLAQRQTKQLGGGLEFADHRHYTFGDDFRYLDWTVYARFGELLVKRFEEEEDLHVYILLDASRSMGFGASEKFDYACRVSAALAYIALADLDRVAITAFAADVVDDYPLVRGKAHILSILQFLERLETRGEDTDLARSIGTFALRKQRRGLTLVVSDLFDPHGFERGLDLLRHQKYEPYVIQIFQREEAEPKVLGDLELFDVESEAGQRVTITERSLRRYRSIFDQYMRSVGKYCRDRELGVVQTQTEVPFDEMILHMMRVAGGVA